MELKITKEKVLEAASKCSTAKATLQTLFPEVFDEKIYFTVGKRDDHLACVAIIDQSKNWAVAMPGSGATGEHIRLSDRYDWEIEKTQYTVMLKAKKKQ